MSRRSSVASTLALVAGAAWVLARLLAPSDSSLPDDERIRVAMAQGAVERRATDAQWEKVGVGSERSLNDALRTGADGRAKLNVGTVADIEIAPRSEFSVREVSRSVSRLRLHEGRISARVPGKGSRLRIEGSDGSASAETERAAFSVAVSPRGSKTVASEEGEVQVSAETVAACTPAATRPACATVIVSRASRIPAAGTPARRARARRARGAAAAATTAPDRPVVLPCARRTPSAGSTRRARTTAASPAPAPGAR